MGSFNKIEVKCYQCGQKHELQSKGGTCRGKAFKGENGVPLGDAAYVKDERFTCEKCGTENLVEVKTRRVLVITRRPETDLEN